MTQKFTSKEIHFLKTGTAPVHPPATYLSDLVHSPSTAFSALQERLAPEPRDRFIGAAVRIDAGIPEDLEEQARDIFEACFNSVLNKQRGIWESLDPTTFVLVFWDYEDERDGIRLLTLLKEKISTRLDTGLLMGIAPYPFHDFSRDQVLGNALKALDHAAFFGPDHMICFDGISLNVSGDRLYQLGKIPSAIEEYEQGLVIDPKNINLINSLGVAYGVTEQLDKALDCFEQASAINPEEVMVIYNIGLIHRINEDEEKALLYLKKAHSINPEIFEIELLLGHLLYKKRRFAQAEPHLDAAVRLNPDSGTAHRIKGEILLDRSDAKAAGAQFNRAVKLSPNDAGALSGYARAMALQKKNIGIALSFARKSVALDPENSLFRTRLEEIREIQDESLAMDRDRTIKSA